MKKIQNAIETIRECLVDRGNNQLSVTNKIYLLRAIDDLEHTLESCDIDPPEFDWDSVQQGDAFEDINGCVLYYIAKDPNDKNKAIFHPDWVKAKRTYLVFLEKNLLTPLPEKNKTEWKNT